MRRTLMILAGTAATMLASPASASLVFNSAIQVSGQGFGAVPRDLTIHANGSATSESGCVGVGAGGAITFAGSCITNGQVHDSNGVANVGGDEPSQQADNDKYGIPTLSALGWASAADIGLLFNPTEPGGDGIVVDDITLKFYDANGAFLAAIDGQHTFASTDPGNGSAGFVFVVDASEQTYLNNTIFNQSGFGNYHIALESSLSSTGGGPESWVAFSLLSPTPFGTVPEPAAWAMMLLGFGGIGMAMRRSRRRGALTQIA